MFHSVGDICVNISQKSNLMWNEDASMVDISDIGRTNWELYVHGPDISVHVEAKAAIQAPKEIVYSCLLAGLKKVSDHWVYKAAVAKVESQFGFRVDTWISGDIAKLEAEETTAYGQFFRVSITPVIYSYLTSEPKVVMWNLEDEHMLRLDGEILAYEQVFHFKMPVSYDAWHDVPETVMAEFKYLMLKELYTIYPQFSHMWTQIRYNWESMTGFSHEYQNAGFKPGDWLKTGVKSPLKQPFEPSQEDRRVTQLPGLNEIVKHPVTSKKTQLKHAIISLNDSHRWSREKIADWLETLDIDLSFKTEENNEQD
jgi:hypothetical protein